MLIKAPRTRKNWLRQIVTGLKNRWHHLMMLRDTPHRVAKGFALGIFIGWLPLVGIQMFLAAGISWLTRANFIASMPGVWFSNPVTMVPMYYLCNRLGAVIAGEGLTRESLAMHWQKVNELGIIDAFNYLFTELSSAFLAMAIGGTLIGLFLSVPGYMILQRAIIRYQNRIAHRRLHWQEVGRKKDRCSVPVKSVSG